VVLFYIEFYVVIALILVCSYLNLCLFVLKAAPNYNPKAAPNDIPKAAQPATSHILYIDCYISYIIYYIFIGLI
jgi:hypothetical protein